ncbi:MAG: EAL domain-containing protein [Burkholderiaceae bacterium]
MPAFRRVPRGERVPAAVIEAEQLRLHGLVFPASAATSAALAVILVAVQSRVVAPAVLALWLTCLLLVVVALALLGFTHGRSSVLDTSTRAWLWRYRAVFAAHGVVWGMAGLFLFPPSDPTHQILLVFALTGLCVSALTSIAFDLEAALAFCVPAMLALVLRLFIQADEFSTAIGALVLMLMICVALVAVRANRGVRDNAGLRAAQAVRVEALQRSDRQLRRAEQLARLGSFEWDLVTGELLWSDEHFRLWGLEPTLDPPSHEQLLQSIHPDDREREESLLQAALHGGGSYESNYRLCWPDGSLHEVHSRIELQFDAAGHALRVRGTVQDVTAVQKARTALGTAQFVVNSVNDMISVIDAGEVYRMVNDAWCRATGLTREQVIGRRSKDLLPSTITQERIDALRDCVEQQEARVVRASVEFVPGRRRFVETTFTPLDFPDGEVRGVVAVTRDITEQEQTRQALATSLENLRRTFDATTDGMFAYDANDLKGRLLFVNQRLFEMWGIAPERRATVALPDIVAAAREMVLDPEGDKRRIAEILALDVPHEDRVHLRDGRVLLRRSVPMQPGGGPTRVWSFRDITREEKALEALRESDGQQRALMDAFPGFIAVYDQDFVYTYVNQRLARLLGKPASELVGRHMRDVLGEQRYVQNVQQVERARRGERAVAERHYEATAERRRVDLQVTHVMGALGTATLQRYYSFGVDITDRTRAEEAQLQAREEAERANRAKSAFLASVSHELRTPLNAILGYAELMRSDSQMSQASSDHAAEIERAGQHLLSLVDDLIDLGRVEAGHLELSLTRVPVEAVINDSLSLVAPLAAKQGIRIVYSGGDARNAMVLADAVRLRQVIINLLSNAIKYNRPEGTVRVSCHRRNNSNGRNPAVVRIAVKDTGFGIPAERSNRVFSAFDRLGAERGLVEGTGIGLVITKRLVNAMGGAIGYESRLDEGSTFWVDLAQAAATPMLRTVGAPPSSVYAPPLRMARPRVLVAEDYAPNQAVLQLQLASLGCAVDVVNDGVAALAKFSSEEYDLVLTDLDMPRMDGLQLARRLRLRESAGGTQVPIIALSAAVSGDERSRCADAGIDDLLSKPIALEGLSAMLQRWLGADSPTTSSEVGPAACAPDLVPTAPAILDLDHLYRLLGRISSTQANALLLTFIEAAQSGLNELAEGTRNPKALIREMHRQHSSALTVGALRYAELAAAIEEQARAEGAVDIGLGVRQLEKALAQVREQAKRLDAAAPTSGPAPLRAEAVTAPMCASVLVVDDDPVVLMQMQQMLASIGVNEVMSARNGAEAIQLMGRRAKPPEVVVCDLNMPEMDGVEMIRRFGQSGFRGGLILMSGADEQLLTTVGKLAELQGLTVLGQIHKPATPEVMRELLRLVSSAPIDRQPARSGSVLTPDAIRAGIAARQFSVWLQPKVNAETLEPVGVEALARWQLKDGSYRPPDSFIVVAERAGIINELSAVLLEQALQEGARLHAAGFRLKVSINLSALWLDDLKLPELMLRSVLAVKLTPADVILEVTETGVTKDLTVALDVLTRLRLKGFGLSIDDFGIGYSSFEQLGRIPFTEMKLDRSFVNRGTQDSAARAILESSMAMAHKLELSTVAEGVETQAELDLMRDLGCDSVQGYLIAKPMPAAELVRWLRARQARLRLVQG